MKGFHRGLVNAHTHLYSGLAPLGIPTPDPRPVEFVDILERIWWRLDRALDEESLRASARLYVSEALLNGCVGLVDHHESPKFIEGSLDVLADICQELGMPAVLCYGATERNDGIDEARRGTEENARFLAANDRSLVRGVLGVHASFTVCDQTLRTIGRVAREIGAVVHVHVAEAGADTQDAVRRGYRGVLHRLMELNALPEGSILAHGVHLGPEETCQAEEHGLWLVQNARSNRANGVGYPRALSNSSRVALGTDGFPADMLEEARALVEDAEQHGEDLVGAMRRLDRGHEILDECFHVGGPPRVEVTRGNIVVDGRHIVQDGVLQTGDMDEIRARAEEQARRLWKRMADL